MLKLALSQSHHGDKVGHFHLENPSTTPWKSVANAIASYKGSNLSKVSMKDWVFKIRQYGIGDAEKVPAVRLLDFYENWESMPVLSVVNTRALAPEVDFGVLSPELLEKYVEYQMK